MSWIVESGGRIIWQPGRTLGQFFVEQLSALEHLVELPSGITSPLADELQVDARQLERFLTAVMDMLSKSNNGALLTLARGVTQVALALHAEATGDWLPVPERLSLLGAQAREVLRARAISDPV